MLTILRQLVMCQNKRNSTTQAAAREHRKQFLVRILASNPNGCTVKQLMTLLAVSQATVCDMLNELAIKNQACFEMKEVEYAKAPVRIWKAVTSTDAESDQ